MQNHYIYAYLNLWGVSGISGKKVAEFVCPHFAWCNTNSLMAR